MWGRLDMIKGKEFATEVALELSDRRRVGAYKVNHRGAVRMEAGEQGA
jgi:hypothetical protein